MTETDGSLKALRLGRDGATTLLAGALLSGVISQVLVAGVHPAPPWQDAHDFAAHYRAIEALPYFYGFALIAGGVMVVTACHRIASAAEKTRTLMALILTAAFVALIGLNYIIQTTFIPEIARHYRSENDPIIAALSMGNPRSLGWALEMWGYGLFGVATWLLAPLFRGDRLERFTAGLLVLNGLVGVGGALLTATNIGWVMTSPGIMSYIVWNVLIVVLSFSLVWVFHRRINAQLSQAIPSGA